jgi:hypothetical protein
VQLVNTESPRVAKTARRIVRMFQFYKQNIDPDDTAFLRFVSKHLEKNSVDVENISYHKLYTHIRNAIREFLHVQNQGSEILRNDE